MRNIAKRMLGCCQESLDIMLRECEIMPRECGILLRECEMMPRECEIKPRECGMLLRECGIMPRECGIMALRGLFTGWLDPPVGPPRILRRLQKNDPRLCFQVIFLNKLTKRDAKNIGFLAQSAGKGNFWGPGTPPPDPEGVVL